MGLLAETEGIFGETAAGVTVAVARKLIQQGRVQTGAPIVLVITGNGLKTLDAVLPPSIPVPTLAPKIADVEAYLASVGDEAALASVR